jgi:lipopolysaccharide heptosyltransferase II
LKVKNVLVIKISAVGDVILSVPSLRAIRAKFPDARIKVLVGIGSRQLLDHCPYIDDRIVCDFKLRDKGLRGLMRLGRTLREQCFDTVIDLQNNRSSRLLGFLSGATLRYGYDNKKWAFLLNRKLKDDAPFLNPIEHQFRLLRMAGVKPQDERLELWPSESDDRYVSAFLNENWIVPSQDLVGIHVRASSRWITKNWSPVYIARLCDRFAEEFNIRVVLTGSKEDALYAQAIARHAKSKPIVAAGKTDLLELAGLIRRFKVFLTPDSAPLHIAAAVGTPVVALFGPTDPKRHVPPAQNMVVVYKDLECSPCYSPHCMKKFACMRKISVDEVFDAMKQFVEKDREPIGEDTAANHTS